MAGSTWALQMTIYGAAFVRRLVWQNWQDWLFATAPDRVRKAADVSIPMMKELFKQHPARRMVNAR